MARLGNQRLRSAMNGRSPAALVPARPFSSLWNPWPYVPRSPLPAVRRAAPSSPNPPPSGPRRARSSRHFGCTLQSVRRSWPKLLSRALDRAEAGRHGRGPHRVPSAPWLLSLCTAVPGHERDRGSRAAAQQGPGGSVRPRRGAPPRARGCGGAGGGQVTPGSKPQVPLEPPEPVALTGSLGRRAARRVHTHLPLRGPRAARRAGGCKRAPGTAAAAAGARPAHGALRRGSAVLIPDRRPARPRSALPLRGGVGRGGKQPPPASQVGPRGPNPLQTSSGGRPGAPSALRPAVGGLRGLLPGTGGYGYKPSLPPAAPAPRPRYCKHCSS